MIKLPSAHNFLGVTRFYKGDNSLSFTNETLTEEQTTSGPGASAIGNNSSGNTVNVISSDVNALQANQNVSEAAISAEGSTAAYALEALEQSQANSNVVVSAAISANTANANDAENVAETIAANSQTIASQVVAAATGNPGSEQYFGAPDTSASGTISSDTLIAGLSVGTWVLILGGIASVAAVYYYYKEAK
jgi:hypothetical protein